MKPLKFYFDKAVDSYEKIGILQKKIALELLRKIETGKYSCIVEIGSGKGFLSIPLNEILSFEKYIHVDISLEFLKKLKTNLKGKHLFINACAEDIPLKENLADLIVSCSALHWIKEPEKSFIKIFDILKKGGQFYFSIFTSNSLKELKMISEISGFGSVFSLKKAEFYIELIKSLGFSFDYELKVYQEIYNSPKDLLIFHKLTGTNYTESKKFSGKNSFKKFCETYKKLFSNHHGVYATYEVLFIRGKIE
ncbi:malonyl-CoA O-methyltransferase [Thermodesulfovibrio aggregans]|uniref:Malonyl-CoA O-methyltransferase n=1 Tax=Thermodesulfovibrio aggregans TaxID=86166 RepID=A0A0U9HNE1_9BACT|nr:methyltransferase domain-containing protein [Thermodesulfovibrio aggregans]GAQ94388.1 malonyl-CoA O-methyltransferase [Thermodesulfovibrio aggregans]